MNDTAFGQNLLGPALVGGSLAFQRYIVPPGQDPASRPRTANCPAGTRFVGWQDVCPPGMLCTQVHRPNCVPLNDRGETPAEAFRRLTEEREAKRDNNVPKYRATLAPLTVTADAPTKPKPKIPVWLPLALLAWRVLS